MALRQRGEESHEVSPAPKVRAMVAAAQRLPLRSVAGQQQTTKLRTQRWQEDAWTYFDVVPEVKYATWFLGNAMAKLRLWVGLADPDDPGADPLPVLSVDEATGEQVPADGITLDEALRATGELARLRSQYGGQSEIMRELNMNLEVAGEAYLVGYGARPDTVPGDGTGRPEDWDVKSVSEVRTGERGGYKVLTGPEDTKGTELDPDTDTILRVWQRHPRWSLLADSTMAGVLGECRLLAVLTQQQLTEANSRQGAGILLVPNELSFTGADSGTGTPDSDPNADPFQQELLAALTTPIEDPDSVASIMPMVVRGPAAFLGADVFRLLTLGRTADSTLDERIEKRVRRLARGMNLPVEVVEGHMATTFANGEQIDQDLYEDHLEPRVELLVDAITVGFLRPQCTLTNPGVPTVRPEVIERLVVRPDVSALVRQPDTEAAADQAHDRFTISDAAHRRAKGFTDDDAPDPLEVLVRMARKGQLSAEQIVAVLSLVEDAPELPLGGAAPSDPAMAAAMAALAIAMQAHPAGWAQRQAALPAQLLELDSITAGVLDEVRLDPGAHLASIDRELRGRLTVATDTSVGRALERAGNRLRNRLPASARNLAPTGVAVLSWAGPAALTAAGLDPDDMVEGAWDDLEAKYRRWAESAADDANDAMGRIVGGFSVAERTNLKLRQAENIDQSWGWMREQLDALVKGRLLNPADVTDDDVLGEADDTLRNVPTGLVRSAIARAGGQAGLATAPATGHQGEAPGQGVYVTVRADGSPAGGIATGEDARRTLADHGVTVEGYRWVYGPGARSVEFLPHKRLDGLRMVSFTDDRLRNNLTWPPGSHFFPGDHRHCQCDWEPLLSAPSAVPAPPPPARPLSDRRAHAERMAAERAATAGEAVIEQFPGGMTARQSEDWITQRWGTDDRGRARSVHLTGLGRQGAEAMGRAMHEMLSAHPNTARRIRVFGNGADVTKAVQANVRWRIPKMHPRAYADAQQQTGWIRLAGGKARKPEEMLAHLANDVATGFHPPGTATIEATVRHEFGHHMVYEARERIGREALTDRLNAIISSHADVPVDPGSSAWARARWDAANNGVSRYAGKNEDELFAEAVSEATSAPAPRSLARAIYDLLVEITEGAD